MAPERSFVFLCAPEPRYAERCGELGALVRATPGTEPFTFPKGGETPYLVPETVEGTRWRAEYYRYDTEPFEAMRELLDSYETTEIDFRASVENWRGVEATARRPL